MDNDKLFLDFDSPCEHHDFSARYKKNKEKMLRELKGDKSRSFSRITSLALGVAAALLVVPTTIYALSIGMHWENIWPGGNDPVVETKLAENVSNPSTVVNFEDGSVLNVLSVIYDGNICVAEYTLSKPGGVDTYYWSDTENKAKGGWFTDVSTYSFSLTPTGGMVVTDPVRSTEDCLYCYSYIVLDNAETTDTIDLYVTRYPCPIGECTTPELRSGITVETIHVPLEHSVEKTYLVNSSGDYCIVTPISLGFGEFYDPWDVKTVELVFKDGTRYDARTNNNYLCGRMNGQIVICFDRIIDNNEVESVIINEETYNLSDIEGSLPTGEYQEPEILPSEQ